MGAEKEKKHPVELIALGARPLTKCAAVGRMSRRVRWEKEIATYSNVVALMMIKGRKWVARLC